MLGCGVKLRRPDFVRVQIWAQSPGCDGSSASRLDRIIEDLCQRIREAYRMAPRRVESIHEYNGAERPPFAVSYPTIAIDARLIGLLLQVFPLFLSSKKRIKATAPVTEYRVIRAIGLSADSHLSPIKADHPGPRTASLPPSCCSVLLRYNTRPRRDWGEPSSAKVLGPGSVGPQFFFFPRETRIRRSSSLLVAFQHSIAGLAHQGLAPRASFGGAILFSMGDETALRIGPWDRTRVK